MTQIATLVFALGILGLFLLDRDRKARTSPALWLPVVWLMIAGSRPVSAWLGMTPVSSIDQYVEGSPLDRAVLTALLAAGVIVLLGRKRRVGTLLRANGPILLFFCYCAVSILWSDYPEVAIKRWIKAVGELAMVMIVLTDSDPLAAVKRLLARLAFLLLPISILFIKYYPDLGRGYRSWVWTPYYTGVTTDKNMLGAVCLIFGLGSLWRFLQEFQNGGGSRRAGPLIAHGVILAMALWLFLKAGSMTSFACFLLAGGLMVATTFRALGRSRATIHLFVVAVVLSSFSVLFLDVGPGVLETMGKNSTLTGRTGIWDVILHMAGNPLFGTGFESFWLGPRLEKIWSVYWFHPTEAHNGYIDVFLNLGVVGIGLLTVMLVTGYRNVIGMFRRDPEAGRLRLAYFVVAVTYNFTESAFKTMHLVWLAFLLATIAIPEGRARIKGRRAPSADASGSEVAPGLGGFESARCNPAVEEVGELSRFAVLTDPSRESK